MTAQSVLTLKGEKTRSKIVDTAAQLMLQNGVLGTTIEGVCDAARVGRSQIYHYFSDKPDLVRAVIDYQTDRVLGDQEPFLSNLDDWDTWNSWRDRIVQNQRDLGCVGGCPLGSLASELADSDELARRVLSKSFDKWEASFRHGIDRMKRTGILRPDADPERLGAFMLGALQGGLLLCQTRKDAASLATVLDGALDYLRTYSGRRPQCGNRPPDREDLRSRREEWDMVDAVVVGSGPNGLAAAAAVACADLSVQVF